MSLRECRRCHRVGERNFAPAGGENDLWECSNDRACASRADARERARQRAELPSVFGVRITRNKHREPVAMITLVGLHQIYRFTTQMMTAQTEFYRMAEAIRTRKARKRPEPISHTADGFQKYHVDGFADPIVTITLVGWHDIHRLAYNMLRWQVEFSAMGRTMLHAHRRDCTRDEWRELWEMYHGTAEKPLTFVWKRETA